MISLERPRSAKLVPDTESKLPYTKIVATEH